MNAKVNVILHPCICYTTGVLCIIVTRACAKQGIVIGLAYVCASNKDKGYSIILLPTGYNYLLRFPLSNNVLLGL